MERLDGHVSTAQPSLKQAPKVFKDVGVDTALED